jgi:hypothetical protein
MRRSVLARSSCPTEPECRGDPAVGSTWRRIAPWWCGGDGSPAGTMKGTTPCPDSGQPTGVADDDDNCGTARHLVVVPAPHTPPSIHRVADRLPWMGKPARRAQDLRQTRSLPLTDSRETVGHGRGRRRAQRSGFPCMATRR